MSFASEGSCGSGRLGPVGLCARRSKAFTRPVHNRRQDVRGARQTTAACLGAEESGVQPVSISVGYV